MDDVDLTQLRRDRIGLIFQTFILIATLMVRDGIELSVIPEGALCKRTEEMTPRKGTPTVGFAELCPRSDCWAECYVGASVGRTAVSNRRADAEGA